MKTVFVVLEDEGYRVLGAINAPDDAVSANVTTTQELGDVALTYEDTYEITTVQLGQLLAYVIIVTSVEDGEAILNI